MQFFRFDSESGKQVTHFGSDFVMSRILKTESAVQISCMHLDAGGVIGYHQAAVPQLMLVVSGNGKVKGKEDQYINAEAGDAVFWEKDEWHETITDDGLTAIVIEGPELSPSIIIERP
ncbi:cupin domain-containing protein [Jeotgalibacillus proteolyticus]|uniref:Cupin n=1 Tax=Jeotgalibacillus proteolyticus TaxID=2082395 RepID=A0A2S5GDF8_9BACL|nr:cupin domain-containing protein [Jeotgalibacillus proteolyticus]PPA71040.1 cupin [Jeotgalibacillus proteolyticus]